MSLAVHRELEVEGLRLRLVPCCDDPGCGGRAVVAGDGERWVMYGMVAGGASDEQVVAELREASVPDIRRLVVAFGNTWGGLDGELLASQYRFLMGLPAWLAEELAVLEPEQIGRLRRLTSVQPRQGRVMWFCEVLRMLRVYRGGCQ